MLIHTSLCEPKQNKKKKRIASAVRQIQDVRLVNITIYTHYTQQICTDTVLLSSSQKLGGAIQNIVLQRHLNLVSIVSISWYSFFYSCSTSA